MAKFLDRFRSSRSVAEAGGFVVLLLGGILLLSLVSYHSSDPSYFFNPQAEGVSGSNWFGRVGATLAESVLQLFGTAGFLLPFALGVLGWHLLRDKETDSTFYLRVAGAVGLAVSLCALLGLWFGRITFGGELFPAGGYVGEKCGGALSHLFNTPGALLVSGTAVVVLITLLTRLSFVHTVKLLAPAGFRGARRLGSGLANVLTVYRERSRDRFEAEPEETSPAPPRSPSIRVSPPVAAAPLSVKPAQRAPITVEPKRPAESRPAAAPGKKSESRAAKQAALPMDPGSRGYRPPAVDLLNETPPQMIESEEELLERARMITDKLQEFAVNGTVVAIHPGPVVTIFEFKPEAGVKYSKITSMTEDLSLALRAESVRIDRMPGRATVGVEVPNRRQETIYPRDLFASKRFKESESKLTLALGKDIGGEVFTADLARMPHLLVAGATGAGKSVGINGMIASILYKASPDEVRFIMIDTKMIELGIYAGIPHLLVPVVTEAKNASTALKWACREMEGRYRKLASVGVRNIKQFNDLLTAEPGRTMQDAKTGEETPLSKLPYIVIVIDELADLMMVSSADVEESIMRLAQMARAVGIHLIVATQRPSVDVITGTIKANFPSRIAFRVSQRVDSRTIIDRQGAEHLLGRGDMLFIPPGSSRLLRVHGGMITEPELARITAYIKKMAEPVYDETVLKDGDEAGGEFEAGDRDEMYERAVRTVIQEGKCSITLIQRRLQLGYARAARIVDMMESEGVVSIGEGSKPREILVGPEFVDQLEAPQ